MSGYFDQAYSHQGYDVTQACANGHVVTDRAETEPEHCQEFCAKCGAPTITKCPNCQTPIRGHFHSEAIFLGRAKIPNYCIRCGSPYPWQVAALQNLEGILREGGLSDQDVSEAQAILPDVVRDTPRTELASLKFKRLLGKLAKPIYGVAISVISDIASETAKKTLGLRT